MIGFGAVFNGVSLWCLLLMGHVIVCRIINELKPEVLAIVVCRCVPLSRFNAEAIADLKPIIADNLIEFEGGVFE